MKTFGIVNTILLCFSLIVPLLLATSFSWYDYPGFAILTPLLVIHILILIVGSIILIQNSKRFLTLIGIIGMVLSLIGLLLSWITAEVFSTLGGDVKAILFIVYLYFLVVSILYIWAGQRGKKGKK